jgi:predicted RNA polymerase sigma factor
MVVSAGHRIVAALAKQILSDTDVRLDFVQTMAIEAASYPHSAFCKNPMPWYVVWTVE